MDCGPFFVLKKSNNMRSFLDDIESGSVKDPMRVASQSMKPVLRRRFYKKVSLLTADNGCTITLDDKPVKTPGGNLLIVSGERIGKLIVEEWQGQEEFIEPLSMPITRLVNAAIDGVSVGSEAVKEDIVRFAGSDLLCYRAENPVELVERQASNWDPLLVWVNTCLDAGFLVQRGIVHIDQPPATIAAFSAHVKMIDDPARLAALHSITALCGSAIIAIAIYNRQISANDAWKAAHVDEDWQVSQWGEDEESSAFRSARRVEFDAAINLLDSLV